MIEFIATVLSVVGNFLVVKKKYLCVLIVYLLSNVVWIVFDIMNKHYSQLSMFAIYSILNVYGIYIWIKEGNN